MRVWPPRRLIRRQALIALGLVLVVATTPLFVLRGIARVSETLDTVQLASKTTGAVADAQRDVLLAQLAVEQLEDGGTSVADLRQQSAFLGRQLQVMAAQDLPGEGEARVRAAQDAHATLLEDIDALAATGATTAPDPRIAAATPTLRADAAALHDAVEHLYSRVENSHYRELYAALDNLRGRAGIVLAFAIVSIGLAAALTWSLRRSVRQEFDHAHRLLVQESQERERAQQETQRSERRFRALVQHSSDVTLVMDRDLTVTWASPAAHEMLGRDPVGTSGTDLLLPDSRAAAWAAVERSSAAPGRTVRLDLELAAGAAEEPTQIAVRLTNMLDDPAVGGFVVNAHDVTERSRTARHLAHLAFHERVTGMPNRLTLERTLEELEDTPGGLSVVVLDLDGLREVNAQHGSVAGDAVLQAVAAALADLPDASAYHLGGDSFALVARRAATRAELERNVETLRAAIRRRRPPGVADLSFGAGAAVAAAGSAAPLEILRVAERAMHGAKASGRNGLVVVDADGLDEAVRRRALTARLAGAIERDELSLAFQPIVEARGGRWVAVEALLRWNGADGPVSPATFIPVAEDSGLIVPIGRWVLETAVRSLVQVRAELGLPTLRVNVNVSARQLQDEGFHAVLHELLEQTGVEPAAVVLELTESALLTDPDRAVQLLAGVRAAGVQVALDDFGTGFSSLSYLLRLPVDVVKVDRSFLMDVVRSRRSRTLLSSVVTIAHDLGMRVTVEGIETAEQLAIVADAGADTVQGYLLARPTPAADLAGLVRSGAPS